MTAVPNIRKVREKGARKPKKGKKKTPGRKPRRNTDTKKKLAARLAAAGATDKQIAAGLDISESTFYRQMRFDPEMARLIKEAKEQADEQVVTALYARALGYNVDEDTFELTKHGMVLTKRVPKHVPPDTKAQIFWLMNRKRSDWKQRQTLEDPNGQPLATAFVVPSFGSAVSLPSNDGKQQ